VNVPFSTLLDDATKTLLAPAALEAALSSGTGIDPARGGQIVATCGSGTTACVVALALHTLGRSFESTRLYDGSWSEYGGAKGVPIAVGAK
jgi:thiosulfate/3-mercaptopyruvate sulfurtransferase